MMDDLIEKIAKYIGKWEYLSKPTRPGWMIFNKASVFKKDIGEEHFSQTAIGVLKALGIGTTHALVPLEPTDEMAEFALRERNEFSCTISRRQYKKIYKAMIKAAQESE